MEKLCSKGDSLNILRIFTFAFFDFGVKVMPVYILIRIFVSTYITLSGFGHFLYYWNKYSPKVIFKFRIISGHFLDRIRMSFTQGAYDKLPRFPP